MRGEANEDDVPLLRDPKTLGVLFQLILCILIAGVTAVLAFALTWPPAMALFRFGPLHPDDLGLAAASGLSILVVLELLKPLWRSGFRA